MKKKTLMLLAALSFFGFSGAASAGHSYTFRKGRAQCQTHCKVRCFRKYRGYKKYRGYGKYQHHRGFYRGRKKCFKTCNTTCTRPVRVCRTKKIFRKKCRWAGGLFNWYRVCKLRPKFIQRCHTRLKTRTYTSRKRIR